MVQTIAYYNLQQAESLRYLQQFLRVIRAAGNLSDALSDALTEIEGLLTQAEAAYRQESSASQSARLLQLEGERDDLVSGLGKLCDGFRDDPDAASRSAAVKLHANLKLYGGTGVIVRQTVKAETTSINSIVRDWSDKPELSDAVRVLNLGRWVDRLKTVNTEYDTLSVARSQERAQVDIAINYTVKDKLSAIKPLYDEVATLLSAGASTARRQHQDERPWLNVIGAANAVSEEFATLLAARATRAKAPEAPAS
ncbi:MAG: hypothetical protein EOP50_11465 [Sphingobacteriales bacterium]|nr:MAG: hypothetical protein EOP50_11465 [Sphingobacteriales bacterium]